MMAMDWGWIELPLRLAILHPLYRTMIRLLIFDPDLLLLFGGSSIAKGRLERDALSKKKAFVVTKMLFLAPAKQNQNSCMKQTG